jgi:hypothetical protein
LPSKFERQPASPALPSSIKLKTPTAQSIGSQSRGNTQRSSNTTTDILQSFLIKKAAQGTRLWNILLSLPGQSTTTLVSDILNVGHVLDEHSQAIIELYAKHKPEIQYLTAKIWHQIIAFFLLPELHPRQVTYSKESLHTQLYTRSQPRPLKIKENTFTAT